MRIFRCDTCGNALYFENVACLRCASRLAFLPDRMDLCAVEPAVGEAPDLWRRKVASPDGEDGGGRWRLCEHQRTTQACNFAVPAHDPQALCVACRMTRVLPDLSIPANFARWRRIEVAKRRLFYTLARLGLLAPDPTPGSAQGPVFEFKADLPGQPVTTGHAQGVITLNIAEADDDERARLRVALHEPYRTLLGHLRHESGHYFWDRLICAGGYADTFRSIFGDERVDYGQSLRAHYAGGPPPDWPEAFVSAYATAHPWEDWAETWAHYLHMVDLLETAASFNTRVVVPGQATMPTTATTTPAGQAQDPFASSGSGSFDALVTQWVPLTLLVNSLNRSLGQDDAYPFALRQGALDKLRFVHHLIAGLHRGATTQHEPVSVATAP